MRRFALIALTLLAACAGSPAARYDLGTMQQRLDSRGIGFGVSRISGYDDSFAFSMRIGTSSTGAELITDPQAAAQAAAPEGCTVRSVTQQADSTTYVVNYQC